MGSVHKFKRPPKNEQQFRGYRPDGADRGRPARRQLLGQLRSWQKNLIVWSALILLATGLWALGKLFAMA